MSDHIHSYYPALDRSAANALMTRASRRLLWVTIILAAIFLAHGCAGTPETPAKEPRTVQQIHQQAEDAYKVRDYQQALILLEPLARRGNAEAQYIVGYMYFYGQGVPSNTQIARQWIGQAATQGHTKAQSALALIEQSAPTQPMLHSVDTQTAVTNAQPPAPAKSESSNEALPSTKAEAMAVEPQPGAETRSINVETTRPTTVELPPTNTPPTPANTTMANPESTPVTPTKEPEVEAPTPDRSEPAPWTVDKAPEAPATLVAKGEINEWVMAQPPESYTIQLIAGNDRKKLEQFVQRHGIADDIAYFQFTRNGETWLGVVFGSFASFKQAQSVLKNMSPELHANSPWIRDFRSIRILMGTRN